MASLFTKIINGEIPCYKVAEDEQFYAFLDINPRQKGHTLVVPKVEVDRYFDLDDDTLSQMTLFSKRVAAAIKEVCPCDRIATAVIGLEVPHAHVHLVPINRMGDINFSTPPVSMTPEEMKLTANQIAERVEL